MPRRGRPRSAASSPVVGETSPDHAAVQRSLERVTRDALLKRLGPKSEIIRPHAFGERSRARGIGFGVELIRAILEGRKTQTRRLMRPQPTDVAGLECPIARVGELQYVREPWQRQVDGSFLYAVDQTHAGDTKFKPAMYMPRAAARLWLRIHFVRAERLQALSPADLAAEGLPAGQSMPMVWDSFYTGPGERYADNPWVWAIGFETERD